MTEHEINRYVNSLDRDLSKRKKELSSLKQLLSMSSDHEHLQTLSRSAIVILYAHWEGFIKHAFRGFLKIFKHTNSLPVNVLAVYLTGYARKVQFSNHNPDININIINFLKTPHDISNIDIENTFDFKANVSASVLNSIFMVCDQEITCEESIIQYQDSALIKINSFDTKMHKIDEFLGIRHAIAHGELRPISKDDAEHYIEVISQMIEDIKDIFNDLALCYYPTAI